MRHPDVFDRYDADEQEAARPPPRCRTCGSTDVRWRQQGGRWALFSMQPGVEHRCAPDDLSDDFEVLT